MAEQLKHIGIFGTPVACVDYRTGFEAIVRMLQRDYPSAVCASNTHIISHARYDASFGEIMRGFDLVLPDGMPLIWYLNCKGAKLSDRVYGPYFMRYALVQSSPRYRHFFFGGEQSTLDALVANARELNPELNVVGAYSPPYRKWSEDDERENARIIQAANPDFIWVALGGERQERWIMVNQHRHSRGVFLAVGDAFELLAGNRPFAPRWIQRRGLTWLYRLLQEPRRLWARYLKYNSLFLWYLALETLGFEKTQNSKCKMQKERGKSSENRIRNQGQSTKNRAAGIKTVAFIGSRGVPARYSGFETVVAQLGKSLVKRGYEVTVYNRNIHYRKRFNEHEGLRIRWFPALRSKTLETPLHTLLCLVDALWRDYDIVYLCGVGNAPFAYLLNYFSRAKLIINVDGADYRRAKWGPLGRIWLKISERLAIRVADRVIADNPEIVERYFRQYEYRPDLISYGAETECHYESQGILQDLGLNRGGYILFVSRLTPENEAHVAIAGYLNFLEKIKIERPENGKLRSEGLRPEAQEVSAFSFPSSSPPPLVIVGDAGYEQEYYAALLRQAAPAGERVIFAGARYGDAYRELSDNALAFILPSRIEATRLVLLDQMGFGSCIIYRQCEATRHVIGDAGISFGGEKIPGEVETGIMRKNSLELSSDVSQDLARQLERVISDRELRRGVAQQARQRAEKCFSWDAVTDAYEALFDVWFSRPKDFPVPETFLLLGVQVSVLTPEGAWRAIRDAIRKRIKGYVTVTSVHGIMESVYDARVRDIHNHALLVTPDGMPLTWMGRLHGFSHSKMSRVYGPNLMLDVSDLGRGERLRHFYYGGDAGVADALKVEMERRYPGIDVVGTYSPPFRDLWESEEADLIERIAACKPDIVWVGLSTPKQEKFMAAYLNRLETTLMIGVGAAFDFHTGRMVQAPVWIQNLGMEWFFRLCCEPRRLWRRYLIRNPPFIYLALRDRLRK